MTSQTRLKIVDSHVTIRAQLHLDAAFSRSNFSHVPYISHQASLSLITLNQPSVSYAVSCRRGIHRRRKISKLPKRDKRHPRAAGTKSTGGNSRNETIRRAVFFTDHGFSTRAPTRSESDTPCLRANTTWGNVGQRVS